MYIDGSWVEAIGGGTFAVTNPATGEEIGQMPDGGADDARSAIEAADRAFASWSRTTAHERADILHRAWQLMVDRSEDLARLMTIEQGKPLRASRAEVNYGADFLRWFAEEARRITGEWLPSARRDQRFLALKQPVGVVAAVTPWNYPISMLTRKMGPALAAGCTLVLKPAEATPLCAKAVYEVFIDAGVPAGVINMVTASDPVPIGDVFTSDPRVRKLTFTGSTAVGRLLASKAAGNLQRVSVELGGHAPFIVFPDADPVHAAKGAGALKFLNAGQACISPNRLYVHADAADAFCGTLIERVGRLQTGNGLEDGIGVGPLVNDGAVAKVENQVEDARAKGAGVPVGGHRLTDGPLGRGHFFAPTVLTEVTPEMTIYREETFGPIAPVIVYDDVDQVIDMANDTNYGLAAYVYTRDISTAMNAFEDLRFGIIGINDVNPTSASAPFGGMKDSGIGREGGQEGIGEYLEVKLGGFAI
ncbi:MAG: NAD-dependent succinate-semialdehyde dehydrogenase [Actinomycetia bacterium]|nr:NAD-dependent succinate-semialdehyde dehydrogenase [Actinomycetes bacterium]MCP4084543.1 NAD-dependent succinate-semialdehyde dehydrogenase [Actinomycetes bacterium]